MYTARTPRVSLGYACTKPCHSSIFLDPQETSYYDPVAQDCMFKPYLVNTGNTERPDKRMAPLKYLSSSAIYLHWILLLYGIGVSGFSPLRPMEYTGREWFHRSYTIWMFGSNMDLIASPMTPDERCYLRRMHAIRNLDCKVRPILDCHSKALRGAKDAQSNVPVPSCRWFRSMLHDLCRISREECHHSVHTHEFAQQRRLIVFCAFHKGQLQWDGNDSWTNQPYPKPGSSPASRRFATSAYTNEAPTDSGASREPGASMLDKRALIVCYAALYLLLWANMLQRSVLQVYDLVLANSGT